MTTTNNVCNNGFSVTSFIMCHDGFSPFTALSRASIHLRAEKWAENNKMKSPSEIFSLSCYVQLTVENGLRCLP